MATIRCQDCGAERKGAPRNTRYCKPCRLLRDLLYWEDNRRRCGKCNVDFAPIGGRDYFCSAHAKDWRGYKLMKCVLCGKHDMPPIIAGIPLCHDCARSPALRGKLVAALKRGQAQRREQHAVPA